MHKIMAILLTAAPLLAQAETFTMTCQAEASVAGMGGKKFSPAKISAGVQLIGDNLFIRLEGPDVYQIFASSLSSEKAVGKNLTTGKSIGVRTHKKDTDFESEIRIDRASVSLSAFHDMDYQGKKVRINIEGPCQLPK